MGRSAAARRIHFPNARESKAHRASPRHVASRAGRGRLVDVAADSVACCAGCATRFAAQHRPGWRAVQAGRREGEPSCKRPAPSIRARSSCARKDWLCLNGQWQFEIDQGDSGLERGLLERDLNAAITVPFCPESQLSGIENHDFLNAVWYRRSVTIPASWAGRRALLHFQAVDYDATVWVNGVEVGRHRGGFSPFACDLGGVAEPGAEAVITVRARDTREHPQPRGKQARDYAPRRAIYVRTTGIWQSVWLEPVPDPALRRPRRWKRKWCDGPVHRRDGHRAGVRRDIDLCLFGRTESD